MICQEFAQFLHICVGRLLHIFDFELFAIEFAHLSLYFERFEKLVFVFVCVVRVFRCVLCVGSCDEIVASWGNGSHTKSYTYCENHSFNDFAFVIQP